MTTRLQVSLNRNEADALALLAASELRDPREQLRWLLLRELMQLGLLPAADDQQPPAEAVRGD